MAGIETPRSIDIEVINPAIIYSDVVIANKVNPII